ncbi:hypothetical protein C2G38_2039305 [Gigaspora rosea]|uniref:Uncharacterized protein n=1 Tax=Gigaspora rosea TaxID=44941 RepID=A0A397V2A8_9GLOM|nr:hypothetical protein C2G38_2039305 [Gigaspora rosea]
MAQYDGHKMGDDKSVVLTQQESTTFQTFLKCLFFRTRQLTKEIIIRYIKLCFPSKKLTPKSISVLKAAANAAYRSYRDALRSGLENIAVHFIEDFKCFFEEIDEVATFTTEFKEAWQTFMSECLIKMIEELLDDEKKLVKITNLDRLTLDYDIYNAGNILNLNDEDFKTLLKKELGNEKKKIGIKQNYCNLIEDAFFTSTIV